MSFNDAIKKSVLEGFSYSDFSTTKILVTLMITFLISLYIFIIYRITTKNSFYNKKHTQSTKNLISIKNTKHKIAMLDAITGEVLKIFDNAKKAGVWIVETQQRKTKADTVRGSIVRHCIGIADCQTAYGYKWKYAE